VEDLQEEIWVTTKQWTKVWEQYYWLHARTDVERWCQLCDTCTTKYNIGAQFGRSATERQDAFWTTRGKLIPSDCHGQLYQVVRGLCSTYPGGIDNGWSSGDWLLLLWCLKRNAMNKAQTLSNDCCRKCRNAHSQGMAKNYVKTVQECLRKVVSTSQRLGRDATHLLAYIASTHKTTSLTFASMVFRRELCLPWDLLPEVHSDKGNLQPTLWWNLSTSVGGQWQDEGSLWLHSQLWLNFPTWTTGKSPKLLPLTR
jgi:hypothetical protein